MFDLGIWMLPVVGIPLILILIWMYFLARRRSRRVARNRSELPQPTARRNDGES